MPIDSVHAHAATTASGTTGRPAAPISTIAERVAGTSDRFLVTFIDLWLFLAVVLWLFQTITMPAIQYPSLIMLVAGIPARLALRAKRVTLARYLFMVPLCLGVVIVPLFTNGVRTPVMANMPMLVLLAGWLLGRRAAAVTALVFGIATFFYWLAEAQGWWVLATPLRTPDVWAMVWVSMTALTAITVWSLIASYEANFTLEFELQGRLTQALLDATSAHQRLASASQFNEAILLNSPLPMSVYAATGQCVEVNDAYCDLAGASREEMLAQNFREIESWHGSGLFESCQTALTSNLPQRHEMHLVTSFGKEVFVECRILPTLIHEQQHLLLQMVDLSDRKRMEEDLRQLAFHDALTRLPNRRLLIDRLQQALHARKRTKNQLAVLFLDLNRFKQLNDSHGHEAGDFLLMAVARRLKRLVRESDTVARIGGDEFVILLEGLGTDADYAAAHVASVVEKIYFALAQEYMLGDIRYEGSASVGIKIVGTDETDPDRVLSDADAAMYEKKKQS